MGDTTAPARSAPTSHRPRRRHAHHSHPDEHPDLFLLHRDLAQKKRQRLNPAVVPTHRPEDDDEDKSATPARRAASSLRAGQQGLLVCGARGAATSRAFARLKPAFMLLRDPLASCQDRMRGLEALKDQMPALPLRRRRRTNLMDSDEGRVREEKLLAIQVLIHEAQGVELIVGLLMEGVGSLKRWPACLSESGQVTFPEVRAACLDLLSSLCMLSEDVARSLAGQEDLMSFCFYLLTCDPLHDRARRLIGLALTTQDKLVLFQLSDIPNLGLILSRVSRNGLASFCQVLGLIVSDLDFNNSRSNQATLQSQHRELIPQDFVEARNLNHKFLLGLPDFLERLIDLACYTPYGPRSVEGGPRESHDWLALIDDSITAEMERDEQPMEDNAGDESPSQESDEVQDSVMEAEADILARTNALYVMNLLLGGNFKAEVQDILGQKGLIPGLTRLFDHFKWNMSSYHLDSAHLHGLFNRLMEQSPETVVKIQFLRLVHNFCDGNPARHLLLTRAELDEVRRSGDRGEAEGDCAAAATSAGGRAKGRTGLLTKIADAVKQEALSSMFRFWLCRAIEAYLRGRWSRQSQLFLIRRGLLEDVVSLLLNADYRHRENMQASFDLLSELVKSNLAAFRCLEGLLDCETKLKKLVLLINENLVDSNMFIRSLVVSHRRFEAEECPEEDPDAAAFARRSRLLQYFKDFDKQILYVAKLVNLISVDNLTQENVSCLNTSLIILMLARKNEQLETTLESIRKLRKGPIDGRSVLRNLKSLLIFWNEHYLKAEKDWTQLERNSGLPFEYWKNTAQVLLSEDSSQQSSLLYHIGIMDC